MMKIKMYLLLSIIIINSSPVRSHLTPSTPASGSGDKKVPNCKENNMKPDNKHTHYMEEGTARASCAQTYPPTQGVPMSSRVAQSPILAGFPSPPAGPPAFESPATIDSNLNSQTPSDSLNESSSEEKLVDDVII